MLTIYAIGEHINDITTFCQIFFLPYLMDINFLLQNTVFWKFLFWIFPSNTCDNFEKKNNVNNEPVHVDFSSVQSLSHVQLFETPWTTAHQLPCPSSTPGACSDSCPSSQWCHPNISSSIVPFSSCLQSFPASGSFLMSHFFTSGGQSIGVSASTSVLPMNTQHWFPLGLTGLILQSKSSQECFLTP